MKLLLPFHEIGNPGQGQVHHGLRSTQPPVYSPCDPLKWQCSGTSRMSHDPGHTTSWMYSISKVSTLTQKPSYQREFHGSQAFYGPDAPS